MAPGSSAEQSVLAELHKTGLILQSDPLLPSIANIVSGERIAGSWWGHRKGHEIFAVLNRLNSSPDAMVTRLVSGKVTYVHRRLWPDLITIAASRERWQMDGLSRAGGQLYRLVLKKGEVRLDYEIAKGDFPRLSRAGRDIEARLLVYGDEIHTETGAHAKVLMTWSRCPKLSGFRLSRKNPSEARRTFDSIIGDLNNRYSAKATLPWHPARVSSRGPSRSRSPQGRRARGD